MACSYDFFSSDIHKICVTRVTQGLRVDTKPKTAAGTPGIEFFHFCFNVLDKPPGDDSRSKI